jgi:molybdopterin converting factor small subunit
MEGKESEIDLDGPVRLIDLLKNRPELAPVYENLELLKVAVNREIADIETEVHNGDEVAFLPPLSGG